MASPVVWNRVYHPRHKRRPSSIEFVPNSKEEDHFLDTIKHSPPKKLAKTPPKVTIRIGTGKIRTSQSTNTIFRKQSSKTHKTNSFVKKRHPIVFDKSISKIFREHGITEYNPVHSKNTVFSPHRARTYALIRKTNRKKSLPKSKSDVRGSSFFHNDNTRKWRPSSKERPPVSKFLEIAPKCTIDRASIMTPPQNEWISPKLTKQPSGNSLLQQNHVLTNLEQTQFNDLCLMISIGVRLSISKYNHCELLHVDDDDLLMREHVFRFTENGRFDLNLGVTHKSPFNFIFTDYCPFLFRVLRRRYGHECDDYMKSLCGKGKRAHRLASMLSEGKSSASFLISKDSKYIIKSLTKPEFHFLQTILCDYYEHLLAEPNTLLSRFFGCFQVEQGASSHIFVVMENIIPPDPTITRYDLKGSTFGRIATEEQRNDGGILKDLDFSSFILGAEATDAFWRQIEEDSAFLERHGIMDYSLLVGVKKVTDNSFDNIDKTAEIRKSFTHFYIDRKIVSYFNSTNGALRATYEDGTFYPVVYYMGIIDILQPYNIRKKVENVFKRIKESQQEISCVDPVTYSSRFISFLQEKTESLCINTSNEIEIIKNDDNIEIEKEFIKNNGEHFANIDNRSSIDSVLVEYLTLEDIECEDPESVELFSFE